MCRKPANRVYKKEFIEYQFTFAEGGVTHLTHSVLCAEVLSNGPMKASKLYRRVVSGQKDFNT